MAVFLSALIGQAKAKNPLESPDTWVVTGLLIGVLLLGAVILAWVDRWRKRQMRGELPGESLGNFREMFENGEISKEEYERVRNKVANRTVPTKGKKDSPRKPKPVFPETPPDSTAADSGDGKGSPG